MTFDSAFRADLHTHSTVSDGTLSPKDLVNCAYEAGLQALAITDHDNVDGIEEAHFYAQSLGIWLMSGIEISATYQNKSVHILGYGIDPNCKSLRGFLQSQISGRMARNERILQKLASYGLVIDVKSLYSNRGTIGRVHIACELVKNGYVSTVQEAFQKWIGDKAPCYESGVKPSPADCIKIIHQAGGKAFVAHPHLMAKNDALRLLKEFGWDGIEVYYARMPHAANSEWLELANRKGILASGGSDFHGSVKPENPIGCNWVDRDRWNAILKETYWQSKFL